MSLETCIHCGKRLHREMYKRIAVLVDIETGGDVCGSYGTYGNEPHVSTRNHPYPPTNRKDTHNMSSGPHNVLEALTVADGYLDEAFLFSYDLMDDEIDDLNIAKDRLRKVIDAVVNREEG